MKICGIRIRWVAMKQLVLTFALDDITAVAEFV